MAVLESGYVPRAYSESLLHMHLLDFGRIVGSSEAIHMSL
jgi:hypothetical protein